MNTNNLYYFESIASVFHFGKHRGNALCSVILEDESYIYWCINNIPEFTLGIQTLRQIRELFPKFIVTSNFASHIGKSHNMEEYYEDQEWRKNKEESTYERYRGSYTQDEMGYSDDEIDTIFEGDPLAYWNID